MFRSASSQLIALRHQLSCNSRFVATKAKVEKHSKIAAANSSFVQNVFTGEPRVSGYFPYPKVLSEEDLSVVEMVSQPIIRSFEKYNMVEMEASKVVDPEIGQLLKDMGSFGTQVPVEYGGMGCKNTQYARFGELVGGFEMGLMVWLAAHQSIGYKGLLLYGTEQQKQKYLPELVTGEKIACFALTEPEAGSDAAAIKCRAVLSEDGRHYILNGTKLFISNGGIADYFTVFAQTPARSHLGETKDKTIALWVKKGPGLTASPPLEKLGIKLSNTANLYFDNVMVLVEDVIGSVGDGFKIAVNILNNGRYGMACGLSGMMQKLITTTVEHSKNRSQFGNALSSYQGIQEKIARMSILHYATQSHAYMISGLMDMGFQDFQLEAAIAKIYASEAAWYVADETLQILGGMGYMQETGVEKYLRDARIFRIFEGTNEILRLFVALTGFQYAGGQLRELQKSLKNPIGNWNTIVGEGSRRLRRAVGRVDATTILENVHSSLIPEAQLFAKNILLFGVAVERLLMKHGQGVIHEQMLLNRVAEATIDLYTTLVVLSRTTRALNSNLSSGETEKNMCQVICFEANIRIERNLRALRSYEALQNDEALRGIAQQVLQNGGIVHNHPLS